MNPKVSQVVSSLWILRPKFYKHLLFPSAMLHASRNWKYAEEH